MPTGALGPTQAVRVLEGYEQSLAPSLLVLDLELQDFRNANACLPGWTTTLRAADALHLAIAAGQGAMLCSLDVPFVQAAQTLRLAIRVISNSEADRGPEPAGSRQ